MGVEAVEVGMVRDFGMDGNERVHGAVKTVVGLFKCTGCSSRGRSVRGKTQY